MDSLELGIEIQACNTPIYSYVMPHEVQVLKSLIVEPYTALGGESRPKEIKNLPIGHILVPRIARLRIVVSGISFEKCTALRGFADCYSKTDACPQIGGFILVVRDDPYWVTVFIYCQDKEALVEQRRSHDKVVFAQV